MGGESRVELIAWINSLLGLSLTKIEQLGTGAAYAQIFDSIWGDVAMKKIKFECKHEYEYVGNFKVLQLAFERHKIDKVIPVDRLVKCKFQENLEFCQWVKKFWDTYYPGGEYDAAARRKAGATLPSSKSAGTLNSSSTARATRSPGAATRNPVVRSTSSHSVGAGRPVSAGSTSARSSTGLAPTLRQQINLLTQEVEEQRLALETLEKERDFYFKKLRQIEVLIQQEAARGTHNALLPQLQHILYSTEEGFEIPSDAVVPEPVVMHDVSPSPAPPQSSLAPPPSSAAVLLQAQQASYYDSATPRVPTPPNDTALQSTGVSPLLTAMQLPVAAGVGHEDMETF